MSITTRIVTTATALFAVCSLIGLSHQSESVTSPLRARFNANLLRDIFQKSDQDILNVFANISLGELDLKNGYLVKDAVVNFVP